RNMQIRWVVAVVFCLALSLRGQTGGDITGRVTDPSGAAIPNAAVTLTNNATNATRQAESTPDGFYTFGSVPPGVYSLRTEHPGFKTANTMNVEVQVQQTVRLDLTLQIG